MNHKPINQELGSRRLVSIRGTESREKQCRLCHPTEVSAYVDDVCENKDRTSTPEHPARKMNTNTGRQPAASNHSQPCAHQLDGSHQRKREQSNPQRAVTESGSRDGISGDSGGVIVSRAGDKPRP